MTTDFSQYQDKKVVLVVAPEGEGDAEELEGTATVANASGILFKPKGKVKLDLIEADRIIEIHLAEETAVALKAKALKLVTLGQARGHLLERHGFTLTEVNEMSEEDAFEVHSLIDHVAEDLGHVHKDKSETPAAQAVAEAEES